MKRTAILCTIVLALWLALVSQVGAQGVAAPGTTGAPNAWGTPANFLAFKVVLDKYKADLKLMTDAQLQKAYTDLTDKAKATPGLGDGNTQAGAEHRMYVAAVRAEMDARKAKSAAPKTR